MKRIALATAALFATFLAASWTPAPVPAPSAGLLSALPGPADAAAAEGPKAGEIDPKTGKRIKYWVAPMDPTYIRNEPGKSPMGMDLVPVYQDEGGEKEPSSTIRIDPVTLQNMGVRTQTVEEKPLSRSIRAMGTLGYDQSQSAVVTTKFNGWIERIYVDYVGQQVKKGQPLFDIYSPDLVTAQEEYRLALRQNAELANSEFSSVREEAKRLLEASRTKLRYWDLSPAQIRRIENGGAVSKTITVYSPVSGVVTAKNAVLGSYVKMGDKQYEIGDLSTIWVDAEVYSYELPFVHQGMPAEMELDYIPGKRFKGTVRYIYPFLSAQTRTARLRLEFPNPGIELKPQMYATVYLSSKIADKTVVIPQQAIIDTGVRKVVFVALGKGRFEPRQIVTGPVGQDGQVQVLKGLKAGEQLVVSAQFMLDSESNLRATIEKMMEAKSPKASGQAAPAGGTSGGTSGETSGSDLDMSGMTMDSGGSGNSGTSAAKPKGDDLDMSGMTMGSPAPKGSATPAPKTSPDKK